MHVFTRRLIWLVPVGLACLLVGCGSGSGSGSNGTSYVKTINAYVYQRSWFNLNVNVGHVSIGQNLGFGDATLRYTKVGAGAEREIELSPTGGQLPPETIQSTLSGNQYYTVIATANGSNLGATVLADDPTPPASGNFKIRIADEAYTAGPVDIYVASPGTDIDDPKNPAKPLEFNCRCRKPVPAGSSRDLQFVRYKTRRSFERDCLCPLNQPGPNTCGSHLHGGIA